MNRSRFISRSDSLVNLPSCDDLTDILVQDDDVCVDQVLKPENKPENEQPSTNPPTKPYLYTYGPDYVSQRLDGSTRKFLAYNVEPVHRGRTKPNLTDSASRDMTTDMKLIYERGQTRKIIEDCGLKNINSQKRANLYRCLNLLITFFIILVSLGVGILETQKSVVYYTIVVLNFLISIIGTLHFIFRIGQRGIFFKYASLKYQKLLTVANEALFYSNEPADLLRLNHQFRRELEELSYRSFKMSYGPESELRRGG